MALFLGMHDMGGPSTDEETQANWSKYKAAAGKRGSKGLRVHYNSAKGKAFCLTEADSEDQVRAAHQDANIPLNDVLEVNISE